MSRPSSPDHADEAVAGPVVCAMCGTAENALPLGWSTSFERGRTVHHCVSCSREHVRSMEGKLDSEWWD